jgi:hypothetical protein
MENDRVTVALTKGEVRLLLNAINEAKEALESWEFATRMGASVDQTDQLRDKLLAVLDGLR